MSSESLRSSGLLNILRAKKSSGDHAAGSRAVGNLVQLLLFSFLMILVGTDLGNSSNALGAVAVVAIFSIIAFVKPKIAIITIFLGVFSLDWLGDELPFIPSEVSWLQEAMLLALAMKLVSRALSGSRLTPTPIDRWILLLFIVGFASAFVSSVSPIVLFLGFRNYFKYVILFYAIINLDLDQAFLRKLVAVISILVLIQIPIAVLQRMTSSGASGDGVTGTLGPNSSGTLTVLLLSFASLALGFYIYQRIGPSKFLLIGAALFVPIVLNETKVVFFITPPLLIFLLRQQLRRNFARTLIIMTGSALILALSFQGYMYFYGSARSLQKNSMFSREYLSWYLFSKELKARSHRLNRVAAIGFAGEQIAQSPATLLIGFGPGNASASFFSAGEGRIFKQFKHLFPSSFFLPRLILEYGLVGFSLFFGMIYQLFRYNIRARKYLTDTYWSAVSFGLEGHIFLLVSLSFYSLMFTLDALSMPLWLLSAFIVAASKRASRPAEHQIGRIDGVTRDSSLVRPRSVINNFS